MKQLSILLLTLFLPSLSIAQTSKTNKTLVSKFSPKSVDSVKNYTFQFYQEDIKFLQDKINTKKNDKNKVDLVFNNAMLNVFFNNEINSFASSLDDLSLDENFVSLNTDSKTFTVGRNIFLDSKKTPDKALKKVSNILSVSATSSVDKNFSKIYEYNNSLNKYDFASEFSLNIKVTHIFNNSISITPSQKEKIRKHRNDSIRLAVSEEIQKDKEILVYYRLETKEKKDSLLQKVYYKYYKSIADKEIKNLKEKKLYGKMCLSWIGGNVEIPIQGRVLKYKDSAITGNFSTEEFRAWKVEGFFNTFSHYPQISGLKFLKSVSINSRISASIYNNNNFIATNLIPVNFQTISNQNDVQQIVSKSDNVFIGKYEQFETISLKGEISSLFFDSTIGLSAGTEKTIGPYSALNWKLGIPVSLKGKDEKPLLNFEAQWKEINKKHLIGISVGYVFGKFTK